MAARALSDGEANLLALAESGGPTGALLARTLRERGLPSRRDEAWKWSDLRAALRPNMLEGVSPSSYDWTPLWKAAPPSIIQLLAYGLEDEIVENINGPGVFVRNGGIQTVAVAHGHDVVLIERLSAPSKLSAHHTSITISKGSVTRVVIADGAPDAVLLSQADVLVGPSGVYRQFILGEGSKLARLETNITAFDRARIEVGGVYLANAGRQIDLTSKFKLQPIGPAGQFDQSGSTVRQLIKGAARKGGRGVFQGRIEVARGAQKTDARQHHQGLLLEDGAEIYAKPELEIYADDVQCAHGNTAGALDEAALFYMRQRGIPAETARAMLTEAFLLDAVPDDIPARDEIVARIRAWLGGAHG